MLRAVDRLPRFAVAALLALSLLYGRDAIADNFAIEGHDYSGTSAENRIIRWCSSDDSKIRFASANITIAGFRPCGELKTRVTCDAVGNRLIGDQGNVPYDHKDCGEGPRLLVIAHDPPSPPEGTFEPSPLTSKERADLTRDLREIEQAQEKREQKQIQAILNRVVGELLGGSDLAGNVVDLRALDSKPGSASRQSRQSKKDSDGIPAQLLPFVKIIKLK